MKGGKPCAKSRFELGAGGGSLASRDAVHHLLEYGMVEVGKGEVAAPSPGRQPLGEGVFDACGEVRDVGEERLAYKLCC